METNNYFDKELIANTPESEVFFNIFTQDVELTKEDLSKLKFLFTQLSDIDKIEVYNLAQVNNKLELYNELTQSQERKESSMNEEV